MEVDSETVAYHFHEPLGGGGADYPVNFPPLMASWKMARAGGGNRVVLKPAIALRLSYWLLMEIVDLLPPGGERGHGAGGEMAGNIRRFRNASPKWRSVYRLNGIGPTNYANAKNIIPGDAGAGRQISSLLM